MAKDPAAPGVIESLKTILKGHQAQYKELAKKLTTRSTLITDYDKISEIKLNPHYMQSLLFYSPQRYLDLSKDNSCLFYSFLENNLLKTAFDNPSVLLVDIFYKQEQAPKTYLISKSNFFQFFYSKTCFENKKLNQLFESSNISQTLKNFSFESPQNTKQCYANFNKWRQDKNIAHLCSIPQSMMLAQEAKKKKETQNLTDLRIIREINNLIRKGESLQQNVTTYQRLYLKNLCQNLDNQKKFCEPYLSKDLWTRVLNGEEHESKIRSLCLNITKRENYTKGVQNSCIAQVKSNNFICSTQGDKRFNSLFPQSSCQERSQALSESHLKAYYRDCPALIDNEALINSHRLISHFSKSRDQGSSCSFSIHKSYFSLLHEFKLEDQWPLKICYQDPVSTKEVCQSYIPGFSPQDDRSENKVVAQILRRTRGAPDKMKCRVLESTRYNPTLLEFKSGCFIVYDPFKCSTQECPKKIYYKDQLVSGMTYQGRLVFDYIANTFIKEHLSITNIIGKKFKLNPRNLKNLTEIKHFLNSFKNGIIHGMGCIENLLPQYFQSKHFSFCTPVPFIVDKIHEKKGQSFLSLTTSIQNVHDPRVIPWQYLFDAVKNYQLHHPLGFWTLYGIK